MSSIADVAPILRSAKVISGHTGAAVIHLTYDGTLPPTEVLEELRRRGWRDAHPSPPPSSAIDWSRPDEQRGLRYTLRPFTAVTSASFAGSADQRAEAVDRARSVLERSGFLRAPTETPIDAVPATAERAVGRRSRGDAASLVRSVGFEIVVGADFASGVRTRVLRSVTIVEEWEDSVATEVVFRGNRSEVVESVVRFVVEVDEAIEHDFLAALSSHRVVDVRRV